MRALTSRAQLFVATVVAVSLLLVTTMAGCPKPAAEDPARVRLRRVRPLPTAETVIVVEGFLRPHPKPRRLQHLPPFPRFQDPYHLPRRSLRRERRMAYRTSGRKRQLLITHIAARLWRLANHKIDEIRALMAAAKSEGRPPPRDHIDKLQRKVSAHLRECVTLLEGVLENKQPPDMARVRLAHYLRKLKPAASAKLFERLLAGGPQPRWRRAYGLDLAQLWVGLEKPAAALKVLRAASTGAQSTRAVLLRSLALARSGGSPNHLSGLVRRLVRGVGTASRALRRSVVHHLPALLARTDDPARTLQRWSSVDAAGFKSHGSTVSTRLVQQLMDRGEVRSARKVLSTALGSGMSIPAALRARVLRLAGPWKARELPPPAVSWTAQLRAREPAVTRCFARAGYGLRPWRLMLVIPPDGTVREARGAPLKSSRRRVSPGAVPPGLVRCIARIAGGWTFPPWRADRAVRLTATLRPAGP